MQYYGYDAPNDYRNYLANALMHGRNSFETTLERKRRRAAENEKIKTARRHADEAFQTRKDKYSAMNPGRGPVENNNSRQNPFDHTSSSFAEMIDKKHRRAVEAQQNNMYNRQRAKNKKNIKN